MDEYILPGEVIKRLAGREITSEDISTHNTSGIDLRPEDVIVHNMKINYGSKVLHCACARLFVAITCVPRGLVAA